jgi:hypothetical protein
VQTVKKIAVPFMLVVIIALGYSIWVFQTQIADAQKQVDILRNQLTYYENFTDKIQTSIRNLESQLQDLENPMYNVTIVNIASGPWFVPVGVAMFKDFNVTIKNVGNRDVGGLTFKFNILSDGVIWNSTGYDVVMTSPEQLGILHVQESMIVRAEIHSSLAVSFAEKTFVVTVMLDDIVLDEGSSPLSAGFPAA